MLNDILNVCRTAYCTAASGALSTLAGRALFSKTLTPSCVSSAAYIAVTTIGESINADSNNPWRTIKYTNYPRIFTHLTAAIFTAGLTPKLAQNFFNVSVNNKLSVQLAVTTFTVHLLSGLIEDPNKPHFFHGS